MKTVNTYRCKYNNSVYAEITHYSCGKYFMKRLTYDMNGEKSYLQRKELQLSKNDVNSLLEDYE